MKVSVEAVVMVASLGSKSSRQKMVSLIGRKEIGVGNMQEAGVSFM